MTLLKEKIGLTVLPVKDLNNYTYSQCYELNLGDGGRMRSKLRACRHGDPYKIAQAIILTDHDQDIIVGWALVFSGYIDSLNAYFFVRTTERRKGYGTIIANVVSSLYGPKVHVDPWDDRSRKFFLKVHLKGGD